MIFSPNTQFTHSVFDVKKLHCRWSEVTAPWSHHHLFWVLENLYMVTIREPSPWLALKPGEMRRRSRRLPIPKWSTTKVAESQGGSQNLRTPPLTHLDRTEVRDSFGAGNQNRRPGTRPSAVSFRTVLLYQSLWNRTPIKVTTATSAVAKLHCRGNQWIMF